MLKKKSIIFLFMCAAFNISLASANTVFFDSYSIFFEETHGSYTLTSTKTMESRSLYSHMISNHLFGISYDQYFSIDGNNYTVKVLEEIHKIQNNQIEIYKEKYNINTDNIVDIFKQQKSNIDRQLLAIAIKGTGSMDVQKFLAIIGTFQKGMAPVLSLFSDVCMKTVEDRKVVLTAVLRARSISDSELLKFYQKYQEKVGKIEGWEQREIYQNISSDSSMLSFLNVAIGHTNDFFDDPLFYIKKISSDSSVVLAIKLLSGKAPSSEVALQLIGQISSDSSKIQAINFLNNVDFSSKHLVSIFAGISSDSSKVSAIKVVHRKITLSDHALAIIKKISSDSSAVQAITLLSNLQFSGDQIISLIGNISSDSSKVSAIEQLYSQVKDIDTAKKLLKDISSDSSIVKATKILFSKQRIVVTASDIKSIAGIASSNSSVLAIQNFLLDNL